MKKEVFKKSVFQLILPYLTAAAFTAVVIAMIAFGLNQTEQSSRSEGLRLLEEGLMRAAVKCYAVEGFYPDTLSYIEENYGIFIDRTKYTVHYSVIATNLLPDITVIERRR
jgi:hypothetical protein